MYFSRSVGFDSLSPALSPSAPLLLLFLFVLMGSTSDIHMLIPCFLLLLTAALDLRVCAPTKVLTPSKDERAELWERAIGASEQRVRRENGQEFCSCREVCSGSGIRVSHVPFPFRFFARIFFLLSHSLALLCIPRKQLTLTGMSRCSFALTDEEQAGE